MSDGVPQSYAFGSVLFHLNETCQLSLFDLLMHKTIQDSPEDLVKTFNVNFSL